MGDIVLADWSQYKLATVGGVNAASPCTAFLTDQMAYRVIRRVDGLRPGRVRLTPYKGTANTMSPFIILESALTRHPKEYQPCCSNSRRAFVVNGFTRSLVPALLTADYISLKNAEMCWVVFHYHQGDGTEITFDVIALPCGVWRCGADQRCADLVKPGLRDE